MWNFLSRIIFRYRVIFILFFVGITLFMLHSASSVRLSYTIAKLLPADHQVSIDFEEFNQKYGENNILVIGVEDPNFQQLEHAKSWALISDSIELFSGVEQLISVTKLPILVKNKAEKKFELKKWYTKQINSQQSFDSAYSVYLSQPFYQELIHSDLESVVTLMVKLDNQYIKSSAREDLVFGIKEIADSYAKKYKVKVHYSGLPFIRTVDSLKIKKEMLIFIVLTLLITSLILFLFFRSFKATFVSIIVVIVGVIWAFGSMALFDYEISILMALVPPVIIVIGIPNCIFLINKFHNEFKQHNNKTKALKRMVIKIGNITFLTNLTTASGFAAFILTKSETLQQFGVIASLNILFIFILALFIIPIFFSFAKPPKKRHTRHLDKKWVNKIITYFIFIVQHRRKVLYSITIVLGVIGIYGLLLVKTTGNITDDLPRKGVLYKDLKFFEHYFGGVMPLEVIVDTKKKNGLLKLYNIKRIEKLEQLLSEYKEFSNSRSYIDGIKYSKQAFYNGDSSYYSLPNSQEQRVLISYLSNSATDFGNLLMDSLKREARISLRMADISTYRMDSILTDLRPKINKIFNPDQYNVTITGTSVVFLNGTKFLIKNLMLSLLLVILLISIFMAWMFNSYRMVVVSIIPNIIPLLLTGAIMGYFGIALKPSTILVFSIAFGISVDDTIHFLAKYKQELVGNNWNMKKSVLSALKETGVSMFYTSIVLFFGFFIFIASDFGGTVALGLLVSITLLLAMLANLLLLPALLLSLERVITYEAFSEPLMDIFDEEEDIELDELIVKRKKR